MAVEGREKAYVSAAVQAYSDVLRVEILLDKKKKLLEEAASVLARSSREAQNEYFEQTEAILADIREHRKHSNI